MGDVMSNFKIDYLNLENQVYKKAYKLDEVKDRLETVAFDIVRFKDGDKSAGEDLWQVQSSDDGDYIVSLYAADSDEKISKAWTVVASKTSDDLQISYKGDPLVRMSSSKLGIPSSEFNKVAEYLPNKLAENKKLVKALLNELSASTKKAVLNKYPELV